MTDHKPPGWWEPPGQAPRPPLFPCSIVVAAFVAVATLLARGFIAWIR